MGSVSSKAARSAPRQYPKRVPPTSKPPSARPSQQPPQASRGPSTHPPPYASSTKDDAILKDASDPAFASRLQSIGPVSSNPFASSSSPYSPSPPPPPQTGTAAQASPTTTTTNPALARAASRASRPQAPSASTTSRPGAAPPPSGTAKPQAYSPPRNATVAAIEARQALDRRWEAESEHVGRAGFAGRTLVDAGTVARAIVEVRRGRRTYGDVERELRLKPGTLEQLGGGRVIGVVGM